MCMLQSVVCIIDNHSLFHSICLLIFYGMKFDHFWWRANCNIVFVQSCNGMRLAKCCWANSEAGAVWLFGCMASDALAWGRYCWFVGVRCLCPVGLLPKIIRKGCSLWMCCIDRTILVSIVQRMHKFRWSIHL